MDCTGEIHKAGWAGLIAMARIRYTSGGEPRAHITFELQPISPAYPLYTKANMSTM